MKQLKFNHDLADLIREGKKTSTFRMYDDKDLSVNDKVELLDKVNPKNPATWNSIGTARIDKVLEKRLGEVDQTDLEKHEGYTSQEEMLRTYKDYYGDQTTFETPIKIIEFSLLDSDGQVNSYKSKVVEELKLYTDGGSRGNPGPSASGFAIMDAEDNILVKKGVYLGVTTNNQAEYLALKFGLEEARKMHARKVRVYMDSLLVVNQMLGKFKIKNRDLWPIHDSIKKMVESFERVSFTHIPRELNKVADDAVNEALDQAAVNP